VTSTSSATEPALTRTKAKKQEEEEKRQTRDEEREAARRLKIAFADQLWLAQNHPCNDSILAWLCENRADASKIGANRWNLEILPQLIKRQEELRNPSEFQLILDRLAPGEPWRFSQNPQNPQDPPKKRRAHAGKRQSSRKGN
jgi:hypothetical protein